MFNDLPPNSDVGSTEMLNVYFDRLRMMTPEDRLARCLQLSQRVRQIVEAGVRSRYPTASKEENRKRLAAHFVGEELAGKHFGWQPSDGK